MRNGQLTTRDAALCALFTALIAVGAFIKIPIPVCPITFQVMVVNLAALLLGRKGSISALMYMILGLIGLPIFTQGGGLGYVLQPTFGFIASFVISSFVAGSIVDSRGRKMKNLVLATVVNLIILYVIGIIYYFIISAFYLKSGIGIGTVLLYCFVIPIPGDIITCSISCVLARRIAKAVKLGGTT